MTIKFYHEGTKPRGYTNYNDIKMIPFVILRVLVTFP